MYRSSGKLTASSSEPKSTSSAYFLLGLLPSNPEDGGSMFLWNVCEFLPDYTVLHPRDDCSVGKSNACSVHRQSDKTSRQTLSRDVQSICVQYQMCCATSVEKSKECRKCADCITVQVRSLHLCLIISKPIALRAKLCRTWNACFLHVYNFSFQTFSEIVRYFCPILTNIGNIRHTFRCICPAPNLMKIRSSVLELFHAYGQKDRQK
jgi:hypothetical protein